MGSLFAFVFYLAGSYQGLQSDNIKMLLRFQSLTSIALVLFSLIAVVETIFFSIIKHRRDLLLLLLIYIPTSFWGGFSLIESQVITFVSH